MEEYDGLKSEVPEADLMILFSCKGRHAALGPLIEDEIIIGTNHPARTRQMQHEKGSQDFYKNYLGSS